MRERLDVLHQRRRPAQASLTDSRRRRHGCRDAPLDPVHDGASLAGHEPVRRRADPDPDPVEAGAGALGHGVVDGAAGGPMHDDHGLPGADELCREDRAVEDKLGRPGHQHLVLRAGRLTFRAIRQHHWGMPGGHRRELARGGVACATPAGQPGPGHLRDQPLPLPSAKASGRRPVSGEMPGQVGRACACREQARERAGRLDGMRQDKVLGEPGASPHLSILSAGTARSGRVGG